MSNALALQVEGNRSRNAHAGSPVSPYLHAQLQLALRDPTLIAALQCCIVYS
jgi:hypothetical protein